MKVHLRLTDTTVTGYCNCGQDQTTAIRLAFWSQSHHLCGSCRHRCRLRRLARRSGGSPRKKIAEFRVKGRAGSYQLPP